MNYKIEYNRKYFKEFNTKEELEEFIKSREDIINISISKGNLKTFNLQARNYHYPKIEEVVEAILDGGIDEILDLREKVKQKYPLDRSEKEEDESKWKRLRHTRNSYLQKTDWTMLADAPLSSEAKKEVREYRQYLRDFPEIYENKQTSKDYVMRFEEWQEQKPVYKQKKKVLF